MSRDLTEDQRALLERLPEGFWRKLRRHFDHVEEDGGGRVRAVFSLKRGAEITCRFELEPLGDAVPPKRRKGQAA